jgi:glycogen debranching enzyme
VTSAPPHEPGSQRGGLATVATAEPDLARVARAPATILEQPLIRFGPEIAADLPSAVRREWLVTNGLGGYASGTVAGVATRRYHGLLVAALAPPVERTVLVGGSVEWADYDGRRYPLSTHEYGDGTIDPHGYRSIQSFALDGAIPVWTFALGDALLEKRVWMAHGANTTYVTYRLLRGSQPLDLAVSPLVSDRDFHSLGHGNGWQPDVVDCAGGIEVRAFEGAVPFRILAPGASCSSASRTWYWNFLHRQETARGLDDRSDQFLPGTLSQRLRAGEALSLILTTEDQPRWTRCARSTADVIDGPDPDDARRLRPNQLLAVSLPYPWVAGARAARVVDAVGRALLAGVGLRSLSPTDPAYRGDYAGDPVRRDGSYHQGPVWTWLLGAFAEAHARVHGDRSAALDLLRPIEDHLRDAGLGSISEILEGDAPHLPVGCVAQAWGVAETLRVWRALADVEEAPR